MNSKKKSSQAKWRQIAIIFRFLSFLQITQVRTIKTLVFSLIFLPKKPYFFRKVSRRILIR